MNDIAEWGQDEVAGLFHTLAGHQTFQQHNPREVLFLEGDTPSGIYLIHSGDVDLLFHGHDGEPRPLSIAGPGQVLGLSSVLSGRPHTSSAITRTRASVGFIDREKFLTTLEQSPSTWRGVLHLLSRDVNSSYRTHRVVATR